MPPEMSARPDAPDELLSSPVDDSDEMERRFAAMNLNIGNSTSNQSPTGWPSRFNNRME
jgi:hypothetical protein